jgi:hypothetical protein
LKFPDYVPNCGITAIDEGLKVDRLYIGLGRWGELFQVSNQFSVAMRHWLSKSKQYRHGNGHNPRERCAAACGVGETHNEETLFRW